MRKALAMYIDKQPDKNLNPSEIEILGMHMAGLSRPQIAKQVGLAVQTVDRRLLSAQNVIALKNPESLVARGRKAVNKLIPKSIRTYDKVLNDYPNRPGLALRAAGEVLKGTQVLIPKEERESVKETVETKRVIMLERLEIATQFGAQVPVSGEITASEGQQDGSDGLKSSPERPDPTPREDDQAHPRPREIPTSQSAEQK